MSGETTTGRITRAATRDEDGPDDFYEFAGWGDGTALRRLDRLSRVR